MNDSINEPTTKTTRTFRFASGQLLALEHGQIEKIPYLAAMVSSADNFPSICDENGYYTLDPHIEFKRFSFVIDSLSFQSVRQIFTHLPERNDTLATIALFDFLGIGPQPNPTLEEADATFFANLIYSPFLDTDLQIIQPSAMQDMAVRLTFAMAKEEYNFNNRRITDQLYWFMMFILSAYKLFGPRLRHHVHKIAEHCFAVFRPSLLEPLKQLTLRTVTETRKKILTLSNKNVDLDDEDKCSWEQDLDPRDSDPDRVFSFFWRSPVNRRQRLFEQHWDYVSPQPWLLWSSEWPSSEEKLLEPIYKRILETMYERLQSELCQRKNAKKEIDEWIVYDTLQQQLVQDEICKRILEEVSVLIPKLEQGHGELVTYIRNHEQSREASSEHESPFQRILIYMNDASSLEDNQEKALSYELILIRLRQSSLIVDQIRQNILKKLYEVALKQMEEWENTEQKIAELRQSLSFSLSLNKIFCWIPKTTHQSYSIRENRPFPKIQRKYSTR